MGNVQFAGKMAVGSRREVLVQQIGRHEDARTSDIGILQAVGRELVFERWRAAALPLFSVALVVE